MAPHKLNKDKQKHIRERIADMMRAAEPTFFAVEGPCRSGIRSSLCLKGWPWTTADIIADQIVVAALNSIGAKRPTWLEGQPEWTQPGALPIERERCIRCRAPLPEPHWKFCSKLCRESDHNARVWAQRAADRLAKQTAEKLAR